LDLTAHWARECAESSRSRLELWTSFLRAAGVRRVAEVGVMRGAFAAGLLGACEALETYYLIDPWRHLDGWNKPANLTDERFAQAFREAQAATEPFREKRVMLRGRTSEVIGEVPDQSLDFAYVDGDHTLRGITIDLIALYPKIRTGGFIGGDDFTPTIWQHAEEFEPTLVFPFAVHFAEAVAARIWALPHSQFLIEKGAAPAFAFLDLTGKYGDLGLRCQLRSGAAPGR
jgi:Methyltransferase domain